MENVGEKNKKVKNILSSWAYRDLAYIGRITGIATLAILVQIIIVLLSPTVQVMKEIRDIFYEFLWEGKPDKIKRNVIINNYEEGGLKLPHIESFCKALTCLGFINFLIPTICPLGKFYF